MLLIEFNSVTVHLLTGAITGGAGNGVSSDDKLSADTFDSVLLCIYTIVEPMIKLAMQLVLLSYNRLETKLMSFSYQPFS